MIFYFLALATLFLVIVTLLPFSRHEAWWIRGLDFPRLQFAIFAMLLLLSALLLLDLSCPESLGILTLVLFCLVYQAWWILPYTRLYPVEVCGVRKADNHSFISIMTANVLTPNRNAARLLELIRCNDPDVIVTLESDRWWQEQLDCLEGQYPYTVKCPLDNLYGMHVYSRYTLSESCIKYLVEPDVPSIHALVSLPCGTRIRAHFLHPAPPSPTENSESSERDAELLMVAKSVAQDDQPVIVTGDLNDVAWSETTRLFRKVSGLLDPRVGRGMYNTFHAGYPLLRWPLDHIFHSRHFTLARITRLPGFGSDHFALFTTLIYSESNHNPKTGLDSDKHDCEYVQSKLESQEVDASQVPAPTHK